MLELSDVKKGVKKTLKKKMKKDFNDLSFTFEFFNRYMDTFNLIKFKEFDVRPFVNLDWCIDHLQLIFKNNDMFLRVDIKDNRSDWGITNKQHACVVSKMWVHEENEFPPKYILDLINDFNN